MANNSNKQDAGAKRNSLRALGGLFFLLSAASLQAQNALESINYVPLAGGEGELVLSMKDKAAEPTVFATDDPPRIIIDLPDTTLTARDRTFGLGSGVSKAVAAVEAGGRTRVVVDLVALAPFDTRVDGKAISVRIGKPVSSHVVGGPPTSVTLQQVDFRRGKSGEGRVTVDFSQEFANADLKVEGSKIVVDFIGASLAEGQRRRLDVLDFATPVQFIDVKDRGRNARVEIVAGDDFEHMAYQSGAKFIVEVKPRRVDAGRSKLGEAPVYTGTPATFNFQDIPVRSLLQLVADVSQFNIVVSDSVSGNVTLRLINVPWDQALDIILQAKGLDKRSSGNVIWVAPTEELAKREQALEDARIAIEDRAPLINEQIPLNYALAKDVAELLTVQSKGNAQGGTVQGQDAGATRSGFLSPRGRVSYDERTNTLLISEIRSRMGQIRDLVAILDRPVPQVLIEARVVSASEAFAKELGARFGLSGAYEDSDGNLLATSGGVIALDQMNNVALINRLIEFQPTGLPAAGPGEQIGAGIAAPSLANRLNVNLPISPGAPRFGFSVLAQDYLLDLELQALETEGRVEVISSPRVITASQRNAKVVQGQRVPFTRVAAIGTGNATAPSTEFIDAGLTLEVTPTISPDGRVFLQVLVTNNSVTGFVDSVPVLSVREANTSVLIDNGQTVVLGGILREEMSDDIRKTPGLGNVPVLGNLFKSRTRRSTKDELLIFVTPRVLAPGA